MQRNSNAVLKNLLLVTQLLPDGDKATQGGGGVARQWNHHGSSIYNRLQLGESSRWNFVKQQPSMAQPWPLWLSLVNLPALAESTALTSG
jgi:hypothetical protein